MRSRQQTFIYPLTVADRLMKYHERPPRGTGEDARQEQEEVEEEDKNGTHPDGTSAVSFILGTIFGFMLAIGSLLSSRTRTLLWWLRLAGYNLINGDDTGGETLQDENRGADISDFSPGNNVSSPGSATVTSALRPTIGSGCAPSTSHGT